MSSKSSQQRKQGGQGKQPQGQGKQQQGTTPAQAKPKSQQAAKQPQQGQKKTPTGGKHPQQAKTQPQAKPQGIKSAQQGPQPVGQQPKKQQPKKQQPKKKQTPQQQQQQQQKQKQQQQNVKKQQKKGARAKVSDSVSGRKKTDVAASQKLARERLQVIIRSKYQNPSSSAKPSPLESQICQYLVDLEASDKDLKLSLRDLGIVACREQDITPTKKAIIIFVPFRQLSRWQKIQGRVAVELEKKFSGQDVLFLAQRKIMKLHDIKNNYPRPRNQTITSVHERILDDLVYPTKIVGKRLRFRVGGKRILKVYLDPKYSKELEPKLQTYEVVYTKLTKKPVSFLFPRYVI